MYALPVIILRAGEEKFTDGILFKLPPELRTPPQFQCYRSLRPGWFSCPQKYWVYVVISDDGTRYVLPGLVIDDKKKPAKKFYVKPYSFTSQQIIEFGRSLTEESDRINKAKEDDLRTLVHDLRALSSAIYNSALEAKTECEVGSFNIAQRRIDTVIATHTMLSIRIDFLEFVTNQGFSEDYSQIPVYKKVDKVVRCFRPKATARNVSIDLRGRSFAHTEGPSIFELIPYAVVDNAIKYAPSDSSISVLVKDETRDIVVDIVSFGPQIYQKERQTIFERGVRGSEAIKAGRAGTGTGLFMSKRLVEEFFDGTIMVDQAKEFRLFGLDKCYRTHFQIIVPRTDGN